MLQPKPVPAVLAAVIRQKLRSEAGSAELAAALGGSTRRRVQLSLPHPAYFLRLDNVADGQSLAAAYPTATRVLLSNGERQVYSVAEIPNNAAGLLPEAVSFEYGPLLDQLLADMATLVGSLTPQAVPKRAELRLLRVPALQVVATWLHWDGRVPTDYLLLTGPVPPCLTAQHLYDGDSFLAALRSPAQQLVSDSKR